jgi:hypothetical protein
LVRNENIRNDIVRGRKWKMGECVASRRKRLSNTNHIKFIAQLKTLIILQIIVVAFSMDAGERLVGGIRGG